MLRWHQPAPGAACKALLCAKCISQWMQLMFNAPAAMTQHRCMLILHPPWSFLEVLHCSILQERILMTPGAHILQVKMNTNSPQMSWDMWYSKPGENPILQCQAWLLTFLTCTLLPSHYIHESNICPHVGWLHHSKRCKQINLCVTLSVEVRGPS